MDGRSQQGLEMDMLAAYSHGVPVDSWHAVVLAEATKSSFQDEGRGDGLMGIEQLGQEVSQVLQPPLSQGGVAGTLGRQQELNGAL